MFCAILGKLGIRGACSCSAVRDFGEKMVSGFMRKLFREKAKNILGGRSLFPIELE